jgi:hypothetical protein
MLPQGALRFRRRASIELGQATLSRALEHSIKPDKFVQVDGTFVQFAGDRADAIDGKAD